MNHVRSVKAASLGGDHRIAKPIKVFVHLARDKDVVAWRQAMRDGTLVGMNDPTPYGYGRAEGMGCTVTFSQSYRESFPAKLLRLAVRGVIGFDYLHARHQRRALLDADVIWTHTESQYLSVAAVLVFKKHRPKLLGQSVWLFDRWRSLTPLHMILYRWLIRKVDVLTVLSADNLAVARALFPEKRTVLVPFGIPSEQATEPVLRSGRPLRILAPGSDRDRDWSILIAAAGTLTDASVLILSKTASPRLARGWPNVRITEARSNAEFMAHLAEATVVCVPLKPNRHASGITVIQEAVLAGVPVVATSTGGLAGYFGPREVRYVPPGDIAALRKALLDTAENQDAARAMAQRAQARMTGGIVGAEAYIRQHVEISREMLST